MIRSIVTFLLTVIPVLGDDVDIGRRIYREGILSSGEPIKATLLNGVNVSGGQFSCASCHRRSGFGGSEGEVYTPPITKGYLFQEREPKNGELVKKLFQEIQPHHARARMRDLRYRPAYDTESLARVLREGADPTGRKLNHLMPRYQLGDTDMRCLQAYLKTLAAASSPGVDEDKLHFATIVTDDVSASEQKAFLDVISAYAKRKNLDTASKQQRPGFSPHYKDEYVGAYRQWKIHQWKLTGSPATWADQLQALYERQAVFAVISGISHQSWQPVQKFCEEKELPCLFPNSTRPDVKNQNYYSLYFSRGLIGEAQALASHLSKQSAKEIVQLIGPGYENLAAIFREKLPDKVVLDIPFERGGEIPSVDAVVLWLNQEQYQTLDLRNPEKVYLSYRILGHRLPDVRENHYLVWPYVLPAQEPPRIFRARAWLRSRRIASKENERLQLNAYFALTIAEHALVHLVENYSRDYFIESIEHEVENSLNPGVYPSLSLGPGQRFASKGCYVVKLTGDDEREVEPVGDWIVTEE